MSISLVLVDDQALVRSGLRALLERGTEFDVLAEAANGEEALRIVREHHPDVVLMDLRMPVLDGLEATRQLCADPSLAGTRVVVLTTFDADEDVFSAIAAGAAGFLLKDTRPDQLREAIRVVHDGGALLSPSVTERVMRAASTGALAVARTELIAGLTERETQVLREVGRGRNNTEIAEVLFLSPATARTYVSRLLAKLGARDRAQLVITAYESGLVQPYER